MRPDSRQIIHMGINYVILPIPIIDQEHFLKFQDSLISKGIDFTHAACEKNEIRAWRNPPLPLQISAIAQTARPQPLGQILIVAPTPNRPLDNFASETEAVLEAFDQTWVPQNRQIISCDVTIRCLYQSTSEHAFKELWEDRLLQSSASLASLERNVLGGGLRFVMPPQPRDPQPTQVEVKIESYLRDTKKIFVETQFAWPQPKPPGSDFDPRIRLDQANNYILNQVHAFMEESHD